MSESLPVTVCFESAPQALVCGRLSFLCVMLLGGGRSLGMGRGGGLSTLSSYDLEGDCGIPVTSSHFASQPPQGY